MHIPISSKIYKSKNCKLFGTNGHGVYTFDIFWPVKYDFDAIMVYMSF